MPSLKKITLIALALLLVGLAKLPFERSYSQELRERKIIPPNLTVERWNRMGQSGLAGVLGGLRSVLAVGLSLEAHTHFTDQEWNELEDSYDLITALDPQNSFYWSTGGWHLAYNAASWARMDPDLSPPERRTVEREYLEKGDAFFKRGLVHLPENVDLWAQIGTMWTSPFKRPDYPRAVKAWKEAADRGNNMIYKRRYFYTLAQIRGREYEALEYGRSILLDYPRNLNLPAFRTILWSLHQLPGLPEQIALTDVFRDKEQAYRDLYNYRFRVEEEHFYENRLDQTLQKLIQELNVPYELNPFLNPRKRRLTKKEWQRKMQAEN